MRRLALACLLAACGGSSSRPDAHPFHTDGALLRDEQGRAVLLRGVNARVDGVFDVTFDDGRVALEPIPALTDADCARMRALGLDLLRLPINWSAIEPTTPGTYDDAYLARVDATVQCAGKAGVSVLVDLHQDGYSKEIGEDGAPLWAIQPPPTMKLQGPLTDLGDRRLSQQVQSAFTSFFEPTDAMHLQERYRAMLGHVAARWADDPAVIGFELFNEPVAAAADVDAFSIAAARAVREAAPDKLVLFEPTSIRNLVDFVPKSKVPFPVEGAVYAPHIYTYVFQPDSTAFDHATPDQLEPSVAAARAEADAWQVPLVIGEFGVGPGGAQNDLWMQTEQQLADRYVASNAFWLWKEESQGGWGVYAHDAAGDTWTERPQVVGWLSRVHAARVAGTPRAITSSAAGDSIHVEIDAPVDAPNLVYVPERFAGTTHVTCDGASVTAARDPATGLLSVACRGVLDVGP